MHHMGEATRTLLLNTRRRGLLLIKFSQSLQRRLVWKKKERMVLAASHLERIVLFIRRIIDLPWTIDTQIQEKSRTMLDLLRMEEIPLTTVANPLSTQGN